MLANFFSKSKPVNFLVLFLVFICYYFPTLFSRDISVYSVGKELFLMIVVFSIYNFIVVKNEVTFDNSFAFLFYILLIGFFIQSLEINLVFYANLTILLFLRKVYSLQSSKKVFHKLFDGGLWLGISFILEPHTVFFFILLYASIYLHQRFTFQTLMIPVLGFVPPVFLYYTYHFWYDNTIEFYKKFSWEELTNFTVYLNPVFIFSITFIGIFTFLCLLLKTPKTINVLNKFRQNWILILIHLLVSMFVLLLIPNKTGIEFLFLLFPSSIILANGLELFQKKWYADVFIILFALGSIVVFFI